jgi:hypothetical protein
MDKLSIQPSSGVSEPAANVCLMKANSFNQPIGSPIVGLNHETDSKPARLVRRTPAKIAEPIKASIRKERRQPNQFANYVRASVPAKKELNSRKRESLTNSLSNKNPRNNRDSHFRHPFRLSLAKQSRTSIDEQSHSPSDR